MSKRVISVLMLVLLMGFSSLAQAEWVNFDSQNNDGPQRPVVQVEQQSDSLTQLNVSLSGVDTETINISGNDYTQVRIPGHWFTLDAGQPEVPFITSSLIIPDAGTPQVRIIKSTWREISTNPAVPSKGDLLRTVDPAAVPYSFGSAYSSNGIYPAAEAKLADPFIMRDYRGVSLRINAVRWDAASGQLLALESMTLEVETTGTGGINMKQGRMSDGIDAQFANLYSLGFDNYVSAAKYNMVSTDGRLLVVCNDAFMGTIQPFVEWKRSTGLDVELISTGSVGGNTSGIQGAIDARYAEPAGLTYVVLVGDQAQVPSYSGTYEGADDDTRYANQEGSDLYPDLFVSRISGTNPSDIQSQINKFIRYERNPDADGTWYKRGAGLASSEGSPPDYTRAEWLRQDMLGYTFDEVAEIYQPSGNASHISAAVNNGVSLVNYIGHGSGTSWSNPGYTISNVHSLSNGYKNPWILDVSCSNGDFSMGECFAEAWMRAGDAAQPDGAVAMYSASTSTPWVPPCVMQAEAVDLMVADQANVIGSLYYHGIMKVMDEYPGNSQLVEQYNIFGDCSLMIRTDTPVAPTMDYVSAIALGSTVYPVDTGIAGAKVALYSDGQLHGVGIADASGHVDVQLDNPVVVAGEVTLTVTGYNLLTQVITLQAVVPVVVDIQPASIPVGATTEVTVTLTDPPSAKATSNVTVTIEGYGVSGLEAVTDENGVAVFSVTPEFGETLTVRGVEDGAGYDMFANDLPVTGAADMPNSAIAAEVASIGMVGTLTPHIEGTVTATSDVADFDLILMGAGLDLNVAGSGNSLVQNVTPSSSGIVTAAIVKTGHNVYLAEIDVVTAFGTLAGTVVDSDGAAVSGVRVYGFNEGDDPNGTPLFDLTTNGAGAFTVADEMAVANYDLYASKFGYLNHEEVYFLMFGANDHEIVMDSAPAGELSGIVTASGDGAAIENASISIRRSDDNSYVAGATTDASGQFSVSGLTYFDYNVSVAAYHFIPQTVLVGINAPSVVKNFILDGTDGNILIIDDSSAAREELVTYEPKLGKNGVVLADGYTAPGSRSAADINTDLIALGYATELVHSSAYDYVDWVNYDMVLVSAGSKTQDLNADLRADMSTFAAAGGKLLIEGGEIAYNHQNDSAFCAGVLHILDWGSDSVGDLSVRDANHYIMNTPNAVAGPISLSYSGYGDSDSVVPAPDAEWPGSWTGASSAGSVICFDPNTAPQGGQIVFFTFSYSSLGANERGNLLQNAVTYLTTSEVGNSNITGHVSVPGGNNSGVSVTLNPGDMVQLTDGSGNYAFNGIFEGSYHLVASKPGYSTDVADVTVGDNATVEQNFTLNAIVTNTFCDEADVEIPDNDPNGGVYCTIPVTDSSTLSAISVYVDITHTYVADMIVELISPAGTVVRLHSNQGGDSDDLVGFYPSDMTPYQNLDALLGEDIQGDWQLHVTDIGSYDFGHINSWCVILTYEQSALSAADDENLPQVLALDGNYPNPFNPMTAIKFSVPSAQDIKLAVYDVRGVKVRTLIHETMAAGHHSVNWMGRDDSGRTVASGTYFYRLQSEGKSVVGKMLLMK
ncbi:MAG: T9SS type A sorting domain-containing protein [bacterium]|nr:T9SS type A sorting domain-containing protein [bacterium]